MLDRTIAPAQSTIVYAEFYQAEKHETFGNTPLYFINAGQQPVFRIEITFQSGIWFESRQALSWLTAKMLLEGTSRKSGKEISEGFDSLGAFVEIDPGFDEVSITVHGLTKNFNQVIELLTEVLFDPTFPEEALETIKAIRSDSIKLNDQKNDMFASKKIREALFGLDYPYGRSLIVEDIHSVTRTQVLEYYHNSLFHSPEIFLSGMISEYMLQTVEEKLVFKKISLIQSPANFNSQSADIYVPRDYSLQTSIKLAWHIPNKSDANYFNFLMTCSLLGGYFGSRLMKEIREEKGYTYGISAYPIHLNHQSFAVISTDVKAENAQDTIDTIIAEINKLKNEITSSDELSTLTSYLAGSFLSSINTPFQLMDRFKKIHKSGLTYDHYKEYFNALKTLTTTDIQEGATKYFDIEAMHSSVVGLK